MSKGRFNLPPDSSISNVVAATDAGYGEVAAAALAAAPTMQLQPWGQVEGTYFAAGKPAAGQVLNIGTDGDEGFGGVLLWPDAYRARVDADGHFAFAKIPSGNFRLFNPRLGPSAFGWPFTKVSVRQGETSSVSGGSCTVAVHPRSHEDAQTQFGLDILTQVWLQGQDTVHGKTAGGAGYSSSRQPMAHGKKKRFLPEHTC